MISVVIHTFRLVAEKELMFYQMPLAFFFSPVFSFTMLLRWLEMDKIPFDIAKTHPYTLSGGLFLCEVQTYISSLDR